MPRRTLSFAERQRRRDEREALSVITVTERLLVLILLELMATRAHRSTAESADVLARAGFSTRQIAGLLGTSEATINVSKNRARKGEEGRR